MHLRAAFGWTLFLIWLACPARSEPSNTSQQPETTDAGVACRALEVHAGAANGMTVVIFHHATESGRTALAALLHEHSGAAAEVELQGDRDKSWHGTVFRLKSCFGRGLLLFPVSVPIKEGEVFRLQVTKPHAPEPKKER